MTAAKRRSLRIRGREYPVFLPSLRDPRLHVAAVLLTLQALGQTVLGFRLSLAQILACLAAGALIEFSVSVFKDKTFLWPASGLRSEERRVGKDWRSVVCDEGGRGSAV